MPTRRIALDVIEEVLPMRHECRYSQREIVRVRAVGRGGELVAAARDGGGPGVAVVGGPGRGSVAGTAVELAGGHRDTRR